MWACYVTVTIGCNRTNESAFLACLVSFFSSSQALMMLALCIQINSHFILLLVFFLDVVSYVSCCTLSSPLLYLVLFCTKKTLSEDQLQILLDSKHMKHSHLWSINSFVKRELVQNQQGTFSLFIAQAEQINL